MMNVYYATLTAIALLAGCSGAPDPATASKPVPVPAAVRKPVETSDSGGLKKKPPETPVSRREQRFDESVGGLGVKGRQSVEAGPGGVRANQSVDVTLP